MRQWQTTGSDVETLDRRRIADLVGSDHYDCGMLDYRGGSLQPLSYSRGLARVCVQQGVTIYGDTEAIRITRSGPGSADSNRREGAPPTVGAAPSPRLMWRLPRRCAPRSGRIDQTCPKVGALMSLPIDLWFLVVWWFLVDRGLVIREGIRELRVS
jgi:hypothetical protein